jgi:hypothetical protein
MGIKRREVFFKSPPATKEVKAGFLRAVFLVGVWPQALAIPAAALVPNIYFKNVAGAQAAGACDASSGFGSGCSCPSCCAFSEYFFETQRYRIWLEHLLPIQDITSGADAAQPVVC